MPAQKEPCANCGAMVDRRTDGFGIDPEKGLLCVRCWKWDHAENGHTQTPWEILTFVTDPNHILIGKGFDVIARLDKDDPLAEGNARLILQATKAHEDLVKAVQLVLAIHDNPEQQSHPIKLDPMAEKQLRDALAKAMVKEG